MKTKITGKFVFSMTLSLCLIVTFIPTMSFAYPLDEGEESVAAVQDDEMLEELEGEDLGEFDEEADAEEDEWEDSPYDLFCWMYDLEVGALCQGSKINLSEKDFTCQQEEKDGSSRDVEFAITDVQSEDNTIISAVKKGSGWELEGLSSGDSTIYVTYKVGDNEYTEEYECEVSEVFYDLDVLDYDWYALPGTDRYIKTELQYRTKDTDGYEKYTKDYKLGLENTGKSPFEIKGTDVVFHAPKKPASKKSYYEETVEFFVGGKSVGYCDIDIKVVNYYYKIKTADSYKLSPGHSITVKPVVKKFELGKKGKIKVSTVKRACSMSTPFGPDSEVHDNGIIKINNKKSRISASKKVSKLPDEFWINVRLDEKYKDAERAIEGSCKINLVDSPAAGAVLKYSGNDYIVTQKEKTVTFKKAYKGKSLTIPAKIKVDSVEYAVTGISPTAFEGTEIKTVTVKTPLLTKKSVKNSLAGSKVETVKVKIGSKKINKKFAKAYKGLFAKSNSGKKVSVKR